ncbi:DUF4212 domain-containing protein [Massilia sp. H6]|uniref:DUF4212 domain-containing protein n=1 Tax=Massilia sp. H6 TaxID=2970464 RepID=UPI0021676D90|nr:DUF4212 domain-containing protein [Massilia sp. H6]UVW28387.1 DUF4212 domain-containing protein [Massilia sp. H6]
MPLDSPTPSSDDGARQRRLLAARAAHWQASQRMTAVLLSLWLVTGYGSVYFARELARFTVFGWPLSFYMAAQGASLVSLAIIGWYAWRMRRLDLACDAAAQDRP